MRVPWSGNTLADEMNFGMNHAPAAGSIADTLICCPTFHHGVYFVFNFNFSEILLCNVDLCHLIISVCVG